MDESADQLRDSVSLDGTWQFLADPEDDAGTPDLADPDVTWPGDAHEVTVPHAWQEDDRYRDYTGTAWYRTTVDVDGFNERAFLRFGAVDYEATVYVDGREVGSNREGYLPFEVEVTEALSSGETVVAVRVTDPEDLSEIPHGKQGDPWYTRVSGIWQSVTLQTRPETFVDDVKATPDLSDDTVTVDVTVAGGGQPAGDLDAEVTVRKDGRDVAAKTCDVASGDGTVTLSIPDADYWTPDQPELYDVVVELLADDSVLDRYEDYFGMRSVSTDDERLYLNGEPLYLRGALDQAYYPDTLYRPFDDDLFEREIQMAKDLGFNMLRKHIKPAHPDFVEAADRLGILVWQEPANPTIYTERSKREVREQLQGLIDRDFNSPSVVAWSLYNEEWGIGLDQEDYSDHDGRLWNDEEKQTYLTELYHEAKEWDPTRLICDNSGWAHVATDLNDYHEYYVSPDRHAAWEQGIDEIIDDPGDNYAVENTSASEAPILISEFGTWGLPDLPKLREHYGGDPSWFDHDFIDGLKRPAGVDERYEGTDLPSVFDGYDDLAETWQRREAVSLKGVIEQMRIRDSVAGYVVTEFSDIEWEFNGILDYLRDAKSFTDEFARVNDDLLVVVEPESRVVGPGERASIDVHVVNDTGDPIEGQLHWRSVDDGSETGEVLDEGERSVSVDGFGTTSFEAITAVEAPADADTGPRSIEVSFENGDRRVSVEEPVVVVAPESTGDRAVYTSGDLAEALAENGHTVVGSVDDADIALVTEVTDDVSAFVEAGGTAIVVPDEDGRMHSNDTFEYRNLPAGESWNLVASLLYQDSELLADLCLDARVGWAFEDIFPYDLADPDASTDTVHVGSVEGWIANWGSPLVVRNYGDGRLCSCTFRVTDTYGSHPTATTLLDRLVREL
ncbi:glycoside hydrolase family 2 protein [Halorhabdus amylolytica]|uniref:glycoside hydrolase family 2 protein n=1 Tax=Halorhabdus amylolytica TaxID=2559573 RepID=UPI0010AA11B9|nr:sugar-binding domain-containing protein [Halorhabdus amylolytica]